MKNKSFKKLLCVFLTLVLSAGFFSIALLVWADDMVAVNETNFPDENWRSVVSYYYDDNEDGYLSAEERNDVTQMSVAGMLAVAADDDDAVIQDLSGIEYFTSLKILRCGGIGLETLDVSQLSALNTLSCQGNNLTSLNVRRNYNLVTMNCSDNNLTELSLTYNVSLETLHCYANQLTSLDLSNIPKLTNLRCDQNKLTSLDLSNNQALTSLNCSRNCLTCLDLSSNTALESVTDYMIGNQSVSAQAVYEDGVFSVALSVDDSSRITYYSTGEFADGVFSTDDYSQICDGIDYAYQVNLGDSEDMSVHIDVNKNFYRVAFYEDEAMTQLLGTAIVNSGEEADAPEIVNIPQCRAFDCWSQDITAVTEDMDVFIVWKEAHELGILSATQSSATIGCTAADDTDSYTVLFRDAVGAKDGDSNFDPCLDVNGDGCLNMTDFALIIKTYN